MLSSFHRVVELADGTEGLVRVDLDDGQHVLARCVVMATGARWRELDADGIERFRNAGVYHAAMANDAERCRDEDVIVVGGGNSAGQAAVHLATRARSVRVVVRGKGLSSSMSQYLIDRIEASPRIEVLTETEIAAVHGTATVETVSLRDRSRTITDVDATAVFVMIGAVPCSEAAAGMLALDPAATCSAATARRDARAISPGRSTDRQPHLLETVRPGVFTAGDVRAGALNRVAGAVGDGALAVRFVHEVLVA